MNVPAWAPKQLLTAKDLLLWEEYVLSRAKFEGDDPGIERICADSIKRKGAVLLVKNVMGLTPSGHPVIIGDKPLEIEAEEGEHILFLRVHNWSTLTEPVAPRDSFEKYQLLWLPPNVAEEDPHFLHLGRWRNQGAESLLLDPPLPRRLQAVRPLLTGSALTWSAWLQPFLERVRVLLPQEVRQKIESTGASVLLSQLRKLCRETRQRTSQSIYEEEAGADEAPKGFETSRLPEQLRDLLELEEPGRIPADFYTISKSTTTPNKFHLQFTNKSLKPRRVRLSCSTHPSVYFGPPVGIAHWTNKNGDFEGDIGFSDELMQHALDTTWDILFSSHDVVAEPLDIRIYSH